MTSKPCAIWHLQQELSDDKIINLWYENIHVNQAIVSILGKLALRLPLKTTLEFPLSIWIPVMYIILFFDFAIQFYVKIS